MKLLAGNSNPELAQEIGKYLNLPLTKATVKRFSDQEVFVEIHENVRGEDVFVIQSTSYPANDNLMELLICIDALRRASARRITAVLPYFGYARQDRKPGPRTPISAKLVSNLITKAGADRVLTMDLHAGQIQGFFDIPTDNLFAAPVMTREISKNKRREKANTSEVMNIIGDVKDYHCVMVDDIVDTSGTLCNAAQALVKAGAKSVSAYVAHGVLSGPAVERITNSVLEEVVVTNSIAANGEVKACKKIKTVSIAPLMGEAIRRISLETSVSSLFD